MPAPSSVIDTAEGRDASRGPRPISPAEWDLLRAARDCLGPEIVVLEAPPRSIGDSAEAARSSKGHVVWLRRPYCARGPVVVAGSGPRDCDDARRIASALAASDAVVRSATHDLEWALPAAERQLGARLLVVGCCTEAEVAIGIRVAAAATGPVLVIRTAPVSSTTGWRRDDARGVAP